MRQGTQKKTKRTNEIPEEILLSKSADTGAVQNSRNNLDLIVLAWSGPHATQCNLCIEILHLSLSTLCALTHVCSITISVMQKEKKNSSHMQNIFSARNGEDERSAEETLEMDFFSVYFCFILMLPQPER